MKVFICSRYAGDTERNAEIAERLSRRAALMGHAPFAPHLMYPRFLRETDPNERELGVLLGLKFLRHCDALWVYMSDGVSEGMQLEIKCANDLGIPVISVDLLD